MSNELPPCPECGEAFSYEQGALLVCGDVRPRVVGDHDIDAKVPDFG